MKPQELDFILQEGEGDLAYEKLPRKLLIALNNNEIDGAIQKTTQKTTQKISRKQREILDFLRFHPKAGSEAIAAAVGGITVDSVKYNLKVLQENGN